MSFSYSPKIITDGLIIYLDASNTKSYSGSGTAWNDISRQGNNGTLVNGPTFDTGNGGSIVFDGVNDYVSFNSNPSLTNQITAEVWVKLSSTTNGTAWVLGREGSYRILYTSSAFFWICATTNNSWYSSGTAINTGSVSPYTQTYHVVGTYDGSSNKIYINGELKTTGSSISGNILSTDTYYLIKGDQGGTDNGKGNVYSHKVYNRALSAQEVLQNYNATKTRFGL